LLFAKLKELKESEIFEYLKKYIEIDQFKLIENETISKVFK